MTPVVPTLITVGVILLAFLGMYLGWRGRRGRQRALDVPLPVPDGLGAPVAAREVFYVATTLRDQPLERVAVAGLGIRARANIAVHDAGVVLALRGNDPVFLPAASIAAVGRAQYTIDRAVDRDGLVVLAWTLAETPVDTYLRVGTPDDTAALVAALETHAVRAIPDASAPLGSGDQPETRTEEGGSRAHS